MSTTSVQSQLANDATELIKLNVLHVVSMAGSIEGKLPFSMMIVNGKSDTTDDGGVAGSGAFQLCCDDDDDFF